jgi:hypothetical protein
LSPSFHSEVERKDKTSHLRNIIVTTSAVHPPSTVASGVTAAAAAVAGGGGNSYQNNLTTPVQQQQQATIFANEGTDLAGKVGSEQVCKAFLLISPI